jgi:hypothetical protein
LVADGAVPLLQVMRQGVINDIKRDRIRQREMQQHEHQQ